MCTFTNPNDPNDDPNADYDGSEGRYPVSVNAIPDGYPTPLTTGLCGVGLTPSDLRESEGITIETDGQVIDGFDFTGMVRVEANDVTIRNCRITASGNFALHMMSGFSGLLVEDTRIRGEGPEVSNAVYLQGPSTLRRVHVSGGADGFKPTTGGIVVQDSYYAGSYRINGTEGSGSGTHNDVVQVRQGEDFTFRHNTLIGPWQMSTSVFLFQTKGGPIDTILVEDNYLSGGGYTIYTREDDYPFTNGMVRNNRIEADSWQAGWSSNTAGSNVMYSGNTQKPS